MPSTVSRRFCRQAISAEDARIHARKRLPRFAFDFIEGGTGDENGLAHNLHAFKRIRLMPRVLLNVSERRLGKTFLGQEFSLPLGFAPMGMCAMAWPGADHIMAAEARRRKLPHCLSSSASISMEDARSVGGESMWLQVYTGDTPDGALRLIERAGTVGYRTIVLTVDVPVLSLRRRDLRNGLRFPMRPGPRQLLDLAIHPRWTASSLIKGPPRPRNITFGKGDGYDRMGSRMGIDWEFLPQLRELWPGRLIVKGVLRSEDAARIKAIGADAIWVSNHGARQMDSSPSPLQVLPAIRNAVGLDVPILFDSGVRSGEDVVKALALGADFVMLGRPILYAIGAGARRGLSTYLDYLELEVANTLVQLGLSDIAGLDANVICTSDEAS